MQSNGVYSATREEVAIFCANAVAKGPATAGQAYLGGKVIDACTGYALAELDRQREAAYYKNKRVRITSLDDLGEEVRISPALFTQTTSGALRIRLEDECFCEPGNTPPPVETPPPLVKLSKHKEVISTGVKIGVGIYLGGFLPTVGSVALSAAAGTAVKIASSLFESRKEDKKTK